MLQQDGKDGSAGGFQAEQDRFVCELAAQFHQEEEQSGGFVGKRFFGAFGGPGIINAEDVFFAGPVQANIAGVGFDRFFCGFHG